MKRAKCENDICDRPAILEVTSVEDKDGTAYIVYLCHICNNSPDKDVFIKRGWLISAKIKKTKLN